MKSGMILLSVTLIPALTDKLDYLIRDARHFGFHCGFDFNRIIQNMKIIQNKLCFYDRVYSDVEKLFNTREEMHRSIYRHPTIEKFKTSFYIC